MKTKEEILGTATQSASHHFENDPEGQLINGGEALTAMQEYADQECIKFVDWILKQPKYKVKSNSNLELLNLYKEQHEK